RCPHRSLSLHGCVFGSALRTAHATACLHYCSQPSLILDGRDHLPSRGYGVTSRSPLQLQGSASKSTLPPVRIIPTRFPWTSSSCSAIDAYGTAADGSMTIFIVSQIVRIAETIACSLTVTMSST